MQSLLSLSFIFCPYRRLRLNSFAKFTLVFNAFAMCVQCVKTTSTVEPQWLEQHRDHENLFEIWVVRATKS